MRNNLSADEIVADAMHQLFVLCKHLSVHHEKDAMVVGAIEKLRAKLKTCFALDLLFYTGVAKYSLMVEGKPLKSKNQLFANFTFPMFQHGIAVFILAPTVTP